MINGLPRDFHFGGHPKSFARIRISIELREVAAGDVYAETVTLQKHVARSDKIDREFVCLAWFEQLGMIRALTVTCAQDSLAHVESTAVRVNIDQLRDKIGVHCVGGGLQAYLDQPRDLEFLAEWLRGVDQHVVPPLDGTLVART